MNVLALMNEIRTATLAARARLNDATISTQAKAGRVQVVRITYNAKGTAIIKPVSEWLPATDAARTLNSLKA